MKKKREEEKTEGRLEKSLVGNMQLLLTPIDKRSPRRKSCVKDFSLLFATGIFFLKSERGRITRWKTTVG